MASTTRSIGQVVDRSKRLPKKVDWFLLLGTLALLTFGLLSQFSKAYGTPSKDFQKQVLNVLVGLVPFAIFWLVKPKFWMRIANVLYIANLLLLAVVLKIGDSKNGAERWINLGFTQFQPSEAAKLLIVITLATFLAKRHDQIHKFSTFALSFLHVAVPVFLIVAEPHLGASIAILAMWLCVCLAAQVPWKFVLGAALGALAFLGVAFTVPAVGKLVLHDYHLKRTGGMFNRNEESKKDINFQQDRAAIALGSGGLFGTGFLKGEQKKLGMIPEQNTDFVFTIIGEEGGLVGSTLVLLAFGFFFYRIWLIYLHATEPYYRMLAAGLLGMLAFHTVINLGMVLQLLPVVGLWLPFMSYGGTAMWLCLACVGLLLNVRSHEKSVLF
ncbi:MAG TPA: FtsW/RodA/SpoVE family cell cycle protein [Fimbriimonadaceae bacterium]|nr:FtsW/RodA/SpoVE family cell cycle protein [Fimbriimonadaceae bacterium]